MSKSRYFCGGSILAVVLALGATQAARAQAAQAATQQAGTEVTEVVVTGSYIAGTPEDAALPVDVLSSQELEKQGSPTVVQLVKTITASQSGIGESNRYNGGAGTASINLRGFGASRTLSLMNGRRMADSPLAAFQGGGADLNFIPTAAVGRIEILKDGAAATYGSEAIGGVVNFITRTDLDGLEVEAEHAFIADSDGDSSLNVAWGSQLDNGNILVTAGYRTRGRLDIRDRDWALQPFENAGWGGWSGAGNPGFYVANSTAGTFIFRDNGCTELGGFLDGAAASSVCRYQFSTFNDLVNEEQHYQFHAEVNANLAENHRFHAEATWNRNWVPDQRISPANLSTQFPTPTSLGGTSGSLANPGALNFFVRYNVPAYHPGLIDLRTTCAAPLTAAQCTAAASANGVDISQTVWRAIAHAGHPTNPDKADHQDIEVTEWRVSGGLRGELPWFGIKYDTALTFMEARGEVNTNDLLVTHIQLALNGFGSLANPTGENEVCQPGERTAANRGNAAVGCYFFNPFTNSIATSAVNGQPNPFYRGGANPAVINNPRLVEWLYGNYTNVSMNQIFVADAVLSGETGIELAGGNVAWAAGAQWRWNRDNNEYGDLFNNEVTPCVDSVDDDTPVCGAPNGPLIFFGSNANLDVDRSVYAVFGEVQIPLLDTLEANFAIRYEDYGGGIGSTTNPKLAVRWQALEWLALRGSIGTTFRAPGIAAASDRCAVGVANLGGQYRAVRTCGNPALQPETADAMNVGFIVEYGGFSATVDYFRFDFEKELTAESASRLFATMFPTTASTANCGLAALAARFQFAGGVCSAANVLRIDVFNVNGPATQTSGYDFRAQYDWDDFLMDGSSWSVGAEATYLIEYQRGAFTLNGAPEITFAPAEDRAGKHDLVAQFFSYPQLRANGFLSFNQGPATLRWQVRYTEGTQPAFGTPSSGRKSDDYWQHDLIVRWELPWDTIGTFSVQNIFDADPSDIESNFNYDYTNGNPLGRAFEVGVKKLF